jgi:phosphoribosylformylglycinamidine synthase subunit PurQ / glutaminase
MSLAVGVVRFPGTNCETETVRAVRDTVPGSRVEVLDHRRTDLAGFDAVILPGGFAYGDYLRAGAIAARAPIGEAVRAFGRAGGVVVGFCNGFQQLQELGMLPGALIKNRTLRYVCATVHLRAEGRPSAATCALDRDAVYEIPIAHGEGCFWADDDELRRLEDEGQIVLRYCDAGGDCGAAANPNGSRGHVAGVANAAGNVVGMMPHPERNADSLVGNADGAHVFRSLAAFCNGGAA